MTEPLSDLQLRILREGCSSEMDTVLDEVDRLRRCSDYWNRRFAETYQQVVRLEAKNKWLLETLKIIDAWADQDYRNPDDPTHLLQPGAVMELCAQALKEEEE